MRGSLNNLWGGWKIAFHMPYAVVPYADYADVGPNKYGVITPSDEQRADPLF